MDDHGVAPNDWRRIAPTVTSAFATGYATIGLRRSFRPKSSAGDRKRGRYFVERCIGWLKECRSVGTRFEKLAVNYLMLVKLAMIERYLRLLT